MNTNEALKIEDTDGYRIAIAYKPFLHHRVSDHIGIIEGLAKDINRRIAALTSSASTGERLTAKDLMSKVHPSKVLNYKNIKDNIHMRGCDHYDEATVEWLMEQYASQFTASSPDPINVDYFEKHKHTFHDEEYIHKNDFEYFTSLVTTSSPKGKYYTEISVEDELPISGENVFAFHKKEKWMDVCFYDNTSTDWGTADGRQIPINFAPTHWLKGFTPSPATAEVPADWTKVVDGSISVPEELDKIVNSIATQIRFHTISGKSEAETVCQIAYNCQKFFHAMYALAPAPSGEVKEDAVACKRYRKRK